MTTEPYARVEKQADGNRWIIRPLRVGLHKPFQSKADAQEIVDALNIAHERGRAELQAALRTLINAAPQDTIG